MKDNRIELADVIRRFKDRYVDEFGHLMMPSQKKALADIAACMTAEMGGHQYRCRDCDHTFWVYHGCRNRACPACHGRQMRDWLEAREIVAMDDTHVTFKYKQRDTGEWKLCRLTGVEFLRRFLMHVLPKGFHKLRYYGLWHPSKRHLQERVRLLLSLLAPVRLAEWLLIADLAAEAERAQEGEGAPAEALSPCCPHCGSHRVQHLRERCRCPGP